MSELEKYIKDMTPIRDVEIVRHTIEDKARAVADKFCKNEEEKELCRNAYMLGMFDTLELVYY